MHVSRLRGRTRETEAVAAVLAGAAVGRGGALVFAGELGLGKSALLQHAVRTATGFLVLQTAGVAAEAHLAYAGLIRLLEPLADGVPRLAEEHRRTVRRMLSGQSCPDADRLPLRLAVLELLGSAGRPVLCCVDDVDAADPATADVLAFVARRVADRPVAMLLTAGDGVDGVRTLQLEALDFADSRALVADRADLVDDAVAAHLAEVGCGNPQALVDLAESLTPGQRAGAAPLPNGLPGASSLRQAYRARIAGLPTETRDLLLLTAAEAAATAESLPTAMLARVAEVRDLALGSLSPAELSGVVRVADGVVSFAQPLVRQTAYELVPLARRRAAHRLLAEQADQPADRLRRVLHLAAAGDAPDPVLAERLAEVAADAVRPGPAAIAFEAAAELAGDSQTAAAYLIAAARSGWLAGRPAYARRLITRVRRTLADVPRTPEADRVLGQTDLLLGEIELRSGATAAALDALLAAADRLARQHRELAVSVLMRASEAARFSGEYPRITEVRARAEALRRPGDSLRLRFVFAQIEGFAATFTGRFDQAKPALREAIALSERLGEPGALTAAGAAALLLGDDHTALRVTERACASADAAGDRAVLPVTLELTAYAQFWLGRHDAVRQSCLAGLRAARAGGQENYAGDHLGLLAVLAAVRGDADECRSQLARLRTPIEAGRVSRPRVLRDWALGVLDLAAGRPAEALSRFAGIADPATGHGHVVVQVLATPWLVEAAARSGAGDLARPAWQAYDQWAELTGDPVRRALSRRCRALLAERGSAEAERHFRVALELHGSSDADFEHARTQLLLGQDLRRTRRPRDAREHLHRAADLFQSAGADYWIDQVRAELRAAGEPVASPGPDATAALTAQQLQIAQLVADGSTNREVAAQLFISTRTVDHHMRNIFHRLGIRSRTELVRALR
ncbi:MAG: AAA family ATPase [Hamadaea sp.]|uniref:LuxR C-terminal-related transcriptional regulator n=1 Tax=Hamadaea sp. TaxID=2024425 RepID=UPI0017ECA479|nr:LuxR family transcriptional regulator [Hamadaea sp.]NUR73387.1 AAA family ATPase [Hamadaea sp.]NUT18534.1 AAA family ATPase [Hamadaea sp.]